MRRVAGVLLRVVEPGSYEYAGLREDYHIRREAGRWVLDAFDSSIPHDHDAAHIASTEHATLDDAALHIAERCPLAALEALLTHTCGPRYDRVRARMPAPIAAAIAALHHNRPKEN